MDKLFTELIGKPKLNPTGKIITIIAENFVILDDQAKFLKATLAIPTEKQLPLSKVCKRLIQLGPLHREVQSQVEKADWDISSYDDTLETTDDKKSICDILESDITKATDRQLIIINDGSRVKLIIDNKKEHKRFLRLIDKWKREAKHFVVVLYQQSQPQPSDTFLRDLEAISDACVRVKSFKSCYMMSIWYQPVATVKTLIPTKIETDHGTCKIGKSFWSADLLCFYDRKKVDKNYDPDLSDTIVNSADKHHVLDINKSGIGAIKEEDDYDGPEGALQRLGLVDAGANQDEDIISRNPNATTLPYIRAQNPEQSRIFYYPDKDDDVDEEDPDDDLGI